MNGLNKTSMDTTQILEKSLLLRNEFKFNEAFEHIQQAFQNGHDELKALAWQHNPIFWSDISAGICILTRRRGEDSSFMRKLWLDTEFIYQFHRHSLYLPPSDQALQRILNQEMSAILSESHAIHWVVRDEHRRPCGLLSLCEISLLHRRAEVLLCVLPTAPAGMAAAAILMLYQFYFKVMKFNKLVSIVYPENIKSIKSTMHLGFKKESDLRRHAWDPRTGTFTDMIQFGLLEEDAFGLGNQRLMQRLLTSRKIHTFSDPN
jgi:RimJ/RimL family protein N-acetyltransferase